MIQFGRVKSFDGARVTLELTGVEENATIEALLLQPGSVAGPSVWLPPAAGDVVAVWYDSERPENSIVFGVVYPDGKQPPRAGKDEIAIQAKKVYLGDSVRQTKPCPRDDHIQHELSAIKAQLDNIASIYSSHTHICAAAGTASAVPVSTYTNSYTVGSTASDSVEVK